MKTKTGIELIAEERQEQITKHGYTIDRDADNNYDLQLRIAAVRLIQDRNDAEPPDEWDAKLWRHMNDKSAKERLIIAGALIAAEIDRLQAIDKK